MSFPLKTLIPDVQSVLRTYLRQGDFDGQFEGLDAVSFLVRQGTGAGDPDVTAPPAVIYPDDLDPGVPVVRLTVEAIELPEGAFDFGDEILVEWRLVLDVLAANETGARTADVDAATAEARLASEVMALLAPRAAYEALQALGLSDVRLKVRGFVSGDGVFRYPVELTFSTLATV